MQNLFIESCNMLLADAGSMGNVADLFDKGGKLMYPLFGLSVIAAMIFFICMWTTRRKDYTALLDLCERDNSCFALTVQVIIMFLRRNPRATIDEVREIAAAEGSRQASQLSRQISWLSDIGSIAPMLGLLGTVLGMMKTFYEMANGNFEGVKQMQMANGIYEAMVTTAGGLVLAIPCMASYFFFRSRIQKSITDMEVAITHILSVISVQMDREERLGIERVDSNTSEIYRD